MRDIKFRVWDKGGKKAIFDWADVLPYIKEYLHLQGRYDLLQYTGLKDKNGKEIYEGDIVRAKRLGFRGIKRLKNTQRVVEWGDGRWQLVNQQHGNSLTSQDVAIHDIEVIGNIYENPDLLKV